jgi:hypothetical protein
MTRSFFIRRDNQGPYPAGVPTPYAMHVHPYPTRFHGPIWTRPVFGFPINAIPEGVLMPNRDIVNGLKYPLPAMNGLNGALGWNVGDGVFRPGGYGGGVFDGNIAGLGATGSYPWGTYSADTLALQKSTNVALKDAAYCPIATDGKLGPATCGARLQLTAVNAGNAVFAAPDTCQSFKYPTLASKGCTSGSAVATTVQPSTPLTPPPEFASAGMGSSTKRALAFAVGGVVAIGVVYMLKKKSMKANRRRRHRR